jgi:hypothetical protein
MAAQLPIEIDQGTVWRRSVRRRTGTTEANIPLDLTGRQLHAHVRENRASPVFIPLVIENLDPAAGSFDLVLDDHARTLHKPDFFWDLLVTAPDGTVANYLKARPRSASPSPACHERPADHPHFSPPAGVGHRRGGHDGTTRPER